MVKIGEIVKKIKSKVDEREVKLKKEHQTKKEE